MVSGNYFRSCFIIYKPQEYFNIICPSSIALFYHVPSPDHLSFLSKPPPILSSRCGETARQFCTSSRRGRVFQWHSEDRIPSCFEQPSGKRKGRPFAAPELKFRMAFPGHSSAKIDKRGTGLSLLLAIYG